MKIYIHTKTKHGAWGGGNQFLKALSHSFERKGVLVGDVTHADAILFNSYQSVRYFLWSIVRFPRLRRVWRLGPEFSVHRRGLKWKLVDRAMLLLASLFAHTVIFQSNWSYERAKRLGFFKRAGVAVIHNAVDPLIFFPPSVRSEDARNPIRLIYTSWSKNWNKGFAFLSYLDRALDIGKYHMTFVGNSPVSFERITMHTAVSSEALADILRENDIFVSPAKDDACSNAILEALACGLPVVALDSGGNGELVGTGGMLFSNEQELLRAIETVAANLSEYRSRISIKTIDTIADEYVAAIYASIG